MQHRRLMAILVAGSSLSILGSSAFAQAPATAPAAATINRTGEAPPADAAVARQAPVDTATVERGADGANAASDIVVTGSRIVRDGYTAPTPVTVATADDLVKSTPSNLPDGLNKLPQFANSQSPSRSALNFAASPIHGNVLNLRGVGPLRTLILFDGLRVAPTTFVGTVDTNVIPNLLIERVEVVTGGASAQYGSDAVSGVVNFVLNKRFTGVTGVAQAGVSQRGDNANQRLGLALGQDFAGGRGHILLSGEYFNSDGMRRDDRSYGRTGLTYVGSVIGCTAPAGSLPNYCSVGGDGNPYVARAGAMLTLGTPYGKITGSTPAGNAFVNTVFNADGSFRPNNPGTPTGSGATTTIGGDGFTIPFDNTAIAPLRTYQTFGRASYEVASDVSAYAQGVFSRSDLQYTSLSNAFSTPNTATLYKGNPFIPAAIDAAIPAGGNITVGEYPINGPKPFTKERTDYWMATGGIEGKLGGLKWDASYTHGDSKMTVGQSGLYDTKKSFAALDAVVAPAGNPGGIAAGTITCNVLLNPDAAIRAQYAGCQPINILGAGPFVTTPAGYAYAIGTARYVARLKQDSVAANVSGNLFDLPAGPIAFAVGAEYRRQSLLVTSNSDPALLAGATAAQTAAIRSAYFAGLRGVPASQLFFYNTNFGTARGKLNVKEAYGELAVPILKDTPFFQELSLNGAGRVTDYSTSGTVWTWKVGGIWKPVPDLLLRANLSRDIRAPNLYELFAGNQSALTAINDPVTGQNVTVSLTNGGNPNLTPEIGKTLTVGGVLSPRFLPGLSMSLDYFRLNITRAIGSLTAQQIVSNCYANAAAAECALVTRPTANSAPSNILVAPANTAFLNTRGIDFDLTYRRSLGDVGMSLRLYVSRLLKYETQAYSGAAVLNLTGLSLTSGNPVGYPKWRGTLTGDLSYHHFGMTISEQYLSKLRVAIPTSVVVNGVQQPFYTAFVDPRVKEVWYTDLTIRFDVPASGGNIQFFGTVNNLFDRQPPLIPSTTVGNNLPTNLSLYDVVGRAFTGGVRFKF